MNVIGRGVWMPLALLLTIGCVGAEVDPDFEMGEERVVVIPFRDRELDLFPSNDAVALGREVARDIRSNNLEDIEVLPPGAVERWFETRDIREMSIQEIGDQLGVRYVIHGQIYRFDTEGDTIGMNSGVFSGRVQVHDVERGRTVFEKEIQVNFPRYPMTGLSEAEIRIGLLKKTGARIGRVFYHHEPVEEEWEGN